MGADRIFRDHTPEKRKRSAALLISCILKSGESSRK